ncbi:MAG: hypothetical protein B7Z12_17000, partial [Caulobacter vibrioides]
MVRCHAWRRRTHFRGLSQRWPCFGSRTFFTQRRCELFADDPPSFQWTPMLAFRSWRGVSDEREASGLSGDL